MAFAADPEIATHHPLAAIGAIGELVQAGLTIGDLAEIGATQRAGIDDAAGCELIGADATGHEAFGLAIAGDEGRIVDLEKAAFLPRAIIGIDALLGEIIPGQQHLAAAISEIEAAGDAERVVGRIAIIGDAEFIFGAEALEITVEREVDHAGDSIGTIGRRGAAGDDFNALDQALRHGLRIDEANRRGSDRALPVDQHQGARCAQVAQVDGGNTGLAVGQRSGVGGRGLRTAHRWQRVHIIADIGLRFGLQFGFGHHGNGRGRVIAGAGDAAAGDGDDAGFRLFGGRIGGSRCGRRGLGEGRCDQRHAGDTQQGHAADIGNSTVVRRHQSRPPERPGLHRSVPCRIGRWVGAFYAL